MDNLIKVKNLSVTRNGYTVFSNISFDLIKTQSINIFGSNGSGKTTLLKTIIGITEPSNGNIENYNSENFFKETIYIGHKSGLKEDLTVKENLFFFQSIYGNQNYSLIKDALDNYKMNSYINTPVKQLSHGQRKRVSLIKTLITNSVTWIIDEPYSSLDEDGIKIFNELAQNHLNNNGALITTNHKPLEKIFINNLNIGLGC